MKLGASLSDWAGQLQGFAAAHTTDVDVVLLRESRTLLTAGLDAACLDMSATWVTRTVIGQCAAAGVVVVAVYRTPAEEQQAIDAGIAHRLRHDVPAESKVLLLRRLQLGATPAAAVLDALDFETPRFQRRLPVVFGGPAGAGVSEIAIAHAAATATDGSTVVIDANDSGGIIAQRLGYAPLPNIVSATTALRAGDSIEDHVAHRLGGAATMAFDVIAGLPSWQDWAKVTGADGRRIAAVCEEHWSSVVVITGPNIEDLSAWVPRHGLGRELLGSAKQLVGVCEATPRGVLRFGEWLDHANPPVPVLTIVNKTPPRDKTVGPQIAAQLASMCGDRVRVLGSVPADRRVADAEWTGTLPAKGPFTKALFPLIGELIEQSETWRRDPVRGMA